MHSYVMSVSVGDHTGQCWLSGFNDVGQMLLGVSAGELEEMKANDEARFNGILQQATCKAFNFNCRAKTDSYNDQVKVKCALDSRFMPLWGSLMVVLRAQTRYNAWRRSTTLKLARLWSSRVRVRS